MALSSSEISALLQKIQTVNPQRVQTNFDRAALFLLELDFENLFDPADARELDKLTFRCKGCLTLVRRQNRKQHHTDHKRELIVNG